MKGMKKFTALIIAFAMVLAMSVSAFAATYTGADATTDGKITISNATSGQKYTIYKLFDANPSGTNGLIAYTASQTVYSWLSTDDTAKDLFTFTANSDNTYNVEQKGSDEAVIAFLKTLITKSGETTTVNPNLTSLKVLEDTATSATVTFEKIPYGYYLIQSGLGAVVTVDSTNKEVTVIDKNQEGPSWDIDDEGTGKAFTDENKNVLKEGDETVTENSANYGDTLHYVIGVNTTNYDGADAITEYYVKDTLATGLQYDKSKMEVYVGTTKLADTAYSVVWNSANNGFEIKIPWVDGTAAAKYTSPNTIKVYYDAKVLDTAALAGEGNKNTANFDYKKASDPDDFEPGYDKEDEKSTTTYVYALGIKKVAKGTVSGENVTEKLLAGAKFAVKDSNGADVKVTGSNGVYSYSSTATSNIVESPTSGVIIIKGLAAGTYTLTESKAPAGYNVLTGPINVTAAVASTSTYTTKITTYYDADGNIVSSETQNAKAVETTTDVNVVPVTVVNKAGSELPETGGMGTTIFYIVGAILVVGAGVVLITRRRMDVQ